MSDHVSKIRNFIIETFMFGQDEDSLKGDSSFLEEGIIDSTGILELVSWMEETYGFEVGDTELIPENLDSVNELAAFIKKKTEKC